MIESSETISGESLSGEAKEVQPSAPNGAGFFGRPGVRQLVKFCIVGGMSTVIDKGLQWLLMTFGEHYAPGVPWWLWQSISFCIAVSNGYFWNRRWTFQAGNSSREVARAQYVKFLATNFVGWILNLCFTKLFLIAVTGQTKHSVEDFKTQIMIASLCAIPIVVIWNFSAAKFWTFRAPAAEKEKRKEEREK